MYSQERHMHNALVEQLMEVQALAVDLEECAGTLTQLAHKARQHCARFEGTNAKPAARNGRLQDAG